MRKVHIMCLFVCQQDVALTATTDSLVATNAHTTSPMSAHLKDNASGVSVSLHRNWVDARTIFKKHKGMGNAKR